MAARDATSAARQYREVIMKRYLRLAPLAVLLALGACVTLPPSGPSMTALPGTGKSFDQFRASDFDCRSYAASQAGVTAAQAADDSLFRSAALGTAVGAVAGAAIGGGQGAAVGAGTGLIVGSATGSNAGATSARGAQQRYDSAYVQCMYAKGHKVPVSGRFADQAPQQGRGYSAPPPNYPPPPPANSAPNYPPPPPGRY